MPERRLRILFVGNSHTYFNDMPATLADLARRDGCACEVTMLAHPGWFLAQHVQDPEASFNIRHGHYDYVVLQEHSHPFAPVEKYLDAVARLGELCAEAGAKPVIYATWARRDEPEAQPAMNELQARAAASVGALLADVGARWQDYRAAHPETEMYYKDGAHASEAGSVFAAGIIWETIRANEKAE